MFGGLSPTQPVARTILIKLLVKISKLHDVYTAIALKEIKLKQFDEFLMLSIISHLQNPKKTEAIYAAVQELSTGLNLLASLKSQKYISEHGDPTDRRSKR